MGLCQSPAHRPRARVASRGRCEYAYAGLSNLGNICYLNSIMQCLLHCGASRQCLLAQPAGDDGFPGVASHSEVYELAKSLVREVPIERHDTLAEVDVLAPHKFLDACLELPAAHFPLGAQHDAAEALGRGHQPLWGSGRLVPSWVCRGGEKRRCCHTSL